ncbi:Wzt carbohydrate-binding domain-containing protein [Dyella sp. ASV21]|uniref:Wzt carbohydrate-binding domain-containing protein n=1 Tax=Dyella sp. ASV21 TaxID=2795114 RepID=UPI0018ECD56E|nr:Wzt carbohydrate-binding domain-containing protein [Dyella sp. ASV21]
MKAILHFHLPRTGGTALREFFEHQVGESRVSKPITGMKLRDALLQWEHAQVISGHFAALQGDRLPCDRYNITVLRNPLDRFLSDHFFRKHNNVGRVIHTSVQLSGFDEFIDQCQGQAGHLVQLDMLSPLALQHSSNPTLDDQLQAAKRAIDTFDGVGVQEELDDFAHMLCAEFGWSIKAVPRSNATIQRITLDALNSRQRTLLDDLLAPEIELYEYALSRFRENRRSYIRCAGREAAKTIPLDASPIATEIAEAPVALEFGDRRAEILQVETVGALLGAGTAMTGERVSIKVRFAAHVLLEQLNIGIAIKDERGGLAFGTNSLQLGRRFARVHPGAYEVTFTMLNRLGCGHYSVDAALVQGLTHLDGCYHWHEDVSQLEVPSAATNHAIGRVLMDASVTLEGGTSEASWQEDAEIAQTGIAGSFGVIHENLQDFRASLQPMADISSLRPGVDTLLQVRASNLGLALWPSVGRNPVNISYRWLTSNGDVVVADGLRSSLPENVSPSLDAIVPMHIRSPSTPGSYILQASLVQEHNAWFIDQAPESGFALAVDVRASQ